MGKSVADSVLDAAWAVVAGCDSMSVCETEPTTKEQADSIKGVGAGKSLAKVTMVGGDFTIADGDTSGRKQTVAAKSGLTIDATGNGDHVALYITTDANGDPPRYVTTAPTQALSVGGTVDVGTWKMEILDPA